MFCCGESSEVVLTNPEPSLRLVLVRHGESQNNALAEQLSRTSEFEARRHVDPDLTDLGRRQAESLATFLADGAVRSQAVSQILPLAHVCVSPMKRALQTAAPLVRRLGVSAEIWTDCFEVGGMYHEGGTESKGLSIKEMKREISCSVPDDVSEDGWCGLRERETREKAKLRANLVATRIRRMAQTDDSGLRGKTLLLLSHHDFMNLLLQSLLKEGKQAHHPNTSITCVEVFESGAAKTVFVACTEHLKSDNLKHL